MSSIQLRLGEEKDKGVKIEQILAFRQKITRKLKAVSYAP